MLNIMHDGYIGDCIKVFLSTRNGLNYGISLKFKGSRVRMCGVREQQYYTLKNIYIYK